MGNPIKDYNLLTLATSGTSFQQTNITIDAAETTGGNTKVSVLQTDAAM